MAFEWTTITLPDNPAVPIGSDEMNALGGEVERLSVASSALGQTGLDVRESLTIGFPRLYCHFPWLPYVTAANTARFDAAQIAEGASYDAMRSTMRGLNPDMVMLKYVTAFDIWYTDTAAIASTSPDWVLTEKGTTIVENLIPGELDISVSDISVFDSTGGYVVIGGTPSSPWGDRNAEVVHYSGTSGGYLHIDNATGAYAVKRKHTSGDRIAPCAGVYKNTSIQYDMSTFCQLADVGHGPETFVDWFVRTTVDALKDADVPWDGVLVDNVFSDLSSVPDSDGNAMGLCGIDYLRDNSAASEAYPWASYAAYDIAHRTGMGLLFQKLRSALGDGYAIVPNGSLRTFITNGAQHEARIGDSTAQSNWEQRVVWPAAGTSDDGDFWDTRPGEASVLAHVSEGENPNITNLITYLGNESAASNGIIAQGATSIPLKTVNTAVTTDDHLGIGGYLYKVTVAPAKSGSNQTVTISSGLAAATVDGQTVRVLTPTHFRLMRYGLCSALIAGAFFGCDEGPYAHGLSQFWFDEYDNAGTGVHYLGQPTGAYSEPVSGVFRRDFDNGIVLVNSNSTTATGVSLGGTFHYLHGVQDTTANPGGTTTTLTLAARDGRILLRT